MRSVPLLQHGFSPWSSNIPLHVLPLSSLQVQARFYSSRIDDKDTRVHNFNETSGSGYKFDAKGVDEDSSTKHANPVGPGSEAPWSISQPGTNQNTGQTPGVTTDMADSPHPASSNTDGPPVASPTPLDPPPVFGFQSLSGLLPRPKPVTRPVEDDRSRNQEKSAGGPSPFSLPGQASDEKLNLDEGWGFSPMSMQEPRHERSFGMESSSLRADSQATADSSSTGDQTSGRRHVLTEASSSSRRRGDGPRITKILHGEGKKPSRSPGIRFNRRDAADRSDPVAGSKSAATPVLSDPTRIRNPFENPSSPASKPLREGTDYLRVKPPGMVQAQAGSPWGLSKGGSAVGLPSESVLQPESQESAGDLKPQAIGTPNRSTSRSANVAKSPASAEASPRDPGAANLTHLTSSGEAHMVDIGAKKDTRRVAVAFGGVRFSNPDPYRLIRENSNQKGDVLGVARIAGIMAAKRTSDLIPLCHPIALTKVEVVMRLHGPGDGLHGLLRSGRGGSVSIQALVECTGPTGVEMEALSAVSAAALTVYDMCKAVDRKMAIASTKIVLKIGGRSRDFGNSEWQILVGKDFLAERALPWLKRESRGEIEG